MAPPRGSDRPPPPPTGGAEPEGEEPPPFLGSWRNVYLLVIGALVAAIIGLTLFTRHYQ